MANYRKLARKDARRVGIDPNVFLRQINQESGFNPRAVSPAGARGIAQFMPGTAAGLGVNPDDPKQALKGAAKLMASYVKKYGSYRKALVAYNAGPGAVGGPLPAETRNYIRSILNGQHPKPGAADPEQPGSRLKATIRPGQDRSAQRKALLQNYLLSDYHNPDGLLNLALGLNGAQDTPSKLSLKRVRTPSSNSTGKPTRGGGVVKFDGKPVAAWVARELRKARANGWQGTVTSGYRSYADQKRIYDSGVRPAAKPGTSNHEGKAFPRGAVDVTDPQGLARALPKNSPLRWAGAKDPVHFSHPHGGGF